MAETKRTTKRTARSTSAERGRRHRRPLQAFGEVERIADERAGWRTTPPRCLGRDDVLACRAGSCAPCARR